MLRKYIKKLVYRERASGEAYIRWLRQQGVGIGKNTCIVDVRNLSIDTTRPYLISIGDDVTFSDHVTILAHDYSWSVITRSYPGEIYPSSGTVSIGNNVFVGSHVTILQNVTIGNNVIIGAGSVVTKDIADGMVVAGVPAKAVTSVEKLREKRAGDAIPSLKLVLERYREVYGRDADEYALREHLAFYQSAEEIRQQHPKYYEAYQLDRVSCDLRIAQGREELIRKVLDDASSSA